jgi:hypothetical protein
MPLFKRNKRPKHPDLDPGATDRPGHNLAIGGVAGGGVGGGDIEPEDATISQQQLAMTVDNDVPDLAEESLDVCLSRERGEGTGGDTPQYGERGMGHGAPRH